MPALFVKQNKSNEIPKNPDNKTIGGIQANISALNQ